VDSVQLENNMKKIYFDGCSYTFGQSLELYCNSLDIFEHNRMSKYKFTREVILITYALLVSTYKRILKTFFISAS